ncbi:hypothetical protein J6590_037968 [Homalodisca vitripennis]|nr:hypothetical protein J6590_037968 [Homalodisca vitripennis]
MISRYNHDDVKIGSPPTFDHSSVLRIHSAGGSIVCFTAVSDMKDGHVWFNRQLCKKEETEKDVQSRRLHKVLSAIDPSNTRPQFNIPVLIKSKERFIKFKNVHNQKKSGRPSIVTDNMLFYVCHTKAKLAKSHSRNHMQELLNSFNWEVFPQPFYSPDLAPSDLHFFPKMKTWLTRQRLDNDEVAIQLQVVCAPLNG